MGLTWSGDTALVLSLYRTGSQRRPVQDPTQSRSRTRVFLLVSGIRPLRYGVVSQ